MAAAAPIPPFGVYVPAVLFLDQNEDLDEGAIRQHVLRLAQVRSRGPTYCICRSSPRIRAA